MQLAQPEASHPQPGPELSHPPPNWSPPANSGPERTPERVEVSQVIERVPRSIYNLVIIQCRKFGHRWVFTDAELEAMIE